jgi:long-chain acyl-CoA synthetase
MTQLLYDTNSMETVALWQGKPGHWQRLTYAQLHQGVMLLRQWLRLQGLGPGQRVGLLRHNDALWVLGYLACLAEGITLVPLHPRHSLAELDAICADAGLAGVLSCTEFFMGALSALGSYGSGPSLAAWQPPFAPLQGEALCFLPLEAPPALHVWEEKKAPYLLPPPAVLAYTSGTTGRPKGVMLSMSNILANVAANVAALRLTRDDCLIALSPLAHVFGQFNVLLSTLCVGGAVVLLGAQPRPNRVLAAMGQLGVSVLCATPTLYQQLLQRALRQQATPACWPRLRVCHTGAAPMPVSRLQQIEAVFGAPVQEGYGLSEATSITCVNPLHGLRKPGWVGLPISGMRVRLASGNDAPGTELEVSGPCVMSGYWRQPEQTARVMTRDGWLKTGDLASIDADGYVRIWGRVDDLINVGGQKLFPREVEEHLAQHPDVAEVAVTAAAHPRHGQVVAAFVVPMPNRTPPTLAQLRAFCEGHLAAYKWPRQLTLCAALPVGATGKLLRRALSAI